MTQLRSPPDPRVVRLSERFSALQTAIEDVHGKPLAFAAASAAWLMAIQNVVGYLIDRALRGDNREELDYQLEMLLQSFHNEVCKHLQVEQQKAVDAAVHFHEIVKDIVDEKG